MKEMSICGALRRLMASDVRSVRLRPIRLAAHPHLEHFFHAVVHPRRVVAARLLLRPGQKDRAHKRDHVVGERSERRSDVPGWV